MDFSPQRAPRAVVVFTLPAIGVGLIALLLIVLAAAYAPPVQAAARAEFSCAEVTHVPQSECEALVDFYNATGGAAWTNMDSPWMVQKFGAPCSWSGVACEFGHVVVLELINKELFGHVVALGLVDKGLFGALPGDVFARLPELIDLTLTRNDLSGPIPQEIAELAYLRKLYLNDNRFSGEIPQGILGHKPIPDISLYRDTEASLFLGHNDLTGTLPVDLGVPLSASAIRHMQVQRNALLHGPIPVEYADAIVGFVFSDTAVCVPRDEAVSTWLNIPPSTWNQDTRMCPRDAAVNVRVEPGANVKVNGEVVSGTVTVDQELRVECDPLRQACAKVELECTLGQFVVAAILGSEYVLQTAPRIDDEDVRARMDEIDVTTALIMTVLEMSPQELADACEKILEEGANPNAATSGVAADDALLVVELEQGSMVVETPQAGIGVQVQTAHASIEMAALATGAVAVDPAVGTVLAMRAQTAIITPTVGGAAHEVAERQGVVIFDDGLVYPFDVQLPYYIPMLVND